MGIPSGQDERIARIILAGRGRPATGTVASQPQSPPTEEKTPPKDKASMASRLFDAKRRAQKRTDREE